MHNLEHILLAKKYNIILSLIQKSQLDHADELIVPHYQSIPH